MSTFNLFTYGTILKGNHNHVWIQGSTFIGDGKAEGFKLYDYVNPKSLQSHYPVAIKDAKATMPLLGEVYQCPSKLLSRCDMLEGEGSLYSRQTIPVDVNGTKIDCYIYVGIPSVWFTGHVLLVPYDMSEKYRLCQYEIKK